MYVGLGKLKRGDLLNKCAYLENERFVCDLFIKLND
jgi:hypothetical protein